MNPDPFLDDNREVVILIYDESVQYPGALHRVSVQDSGLGSKNDKDVLFGSSLNSVMALFDDFGEPPSDHHT